MEPPRQKWTARLLLLLFALAGLAWLGHLDLRRHISTDVLDLVPKDERSPELSIVRGLADQEEARVLLFVIQLPSRAGETAEAMGLRSNAAAAQFARDLAADPAIAQAISLADTGPRDAMGAAIFNHRFELLLPGWLAERERAYRAAGSPGSWSSWLSEQAAADLEHYLSRPEAMAAQDILTADPLLLVPNLVGRVSGLEGSGLGGGKTGDLALVWGQSRSSPLKPEGQEPVFAAVAAAQVRLQARQPGAQLQWTGIARYAAASRVRIEREVSLLNLLSIGLVILVAAACVRKVYRALHLAPVVLGSLLGAWVATTIVWDRVHVLVFVIGSLLAGVAIDYGFYIYLQPRRRPDEPFRERAGRLIRPLLASALTTVIGFSFLLWSELPLIRDLGVFVSAGLICALGTALLWFAQLDNSFLETRPFIRRRPKPPGRRGRRWAQAVLALGALVAILGPWRLHWRDDIRELQIPTPEVQANDVAVRARFGESDDRTVYLTRGDTPAAARSQLDKFLAWHQQAYPQSKAATVGYAVPTEEQWRALPGELVKLQNFSTDFSAALGRHGFDPAAFQSFFEAWNTTVHRTAWPTYAELVNEVTTALKGPMSSLLHVGADSSWFVTISEQGAGPDPPTSTSTVTDSQLQNLNTLFSRYRVSALRLSMVGLGFVGASVFVLYGLRRGIRIFAIPCGACLFAFGIFGLAGATLNLFNLLGAFLGVCLSHNYAIFSAESQNRHEEPPPSIRMSAAAAASSFGVLALSHIPVVAALGSTVAVIVLAALAITELTPLASGDDARQHSGT